MGPFRNPINFGRGASGAGWLVANVCVRASPITMGLQIDAPTGGRHRVRKPLELL
jgi:hypothetical protein